MLSVAAWVMYILIVIRLWQKINEHSEVKLTVPSRHKHVKRFQNLDIPQESTNHL